MRTRIITAIVALCIFVPVCIFSESIVFEIAMAVLNVVAVYELWHCIRGVDAASKVASHEIGSLALWSPNLLLAAGCVFFPRFVGNERTVGAVFMLFVLLMLYTFAVVVFSRGRIQITDAAVLLMMTLYVTMSFTSILCLRRSGDSGASLYLLPFIGAWVSDTFAYFTGRLLGKHKLIPEVSPKKTVEGAIGGIVFTAIAYAVYGCITGSHVATTLLMLAVFGAIISIISQIGDLIASVVKRHYGIKDYGKLFPGHGGVMDRFDSVLATAPVLYILMYFFGNLFS